MILTPEDLKAARHQLGWSLAEMAEALRMEGDPKNAATRIREIEDGRRPLTGPIAVSVEAFLSGFQPEHLR